MTDENAGRVANALIGVAVIAGTYYVLKTPSLRRLAWRVAVTALTGTLPAWLGREVQQAWADSGRRAL